MPRRLLVSEQVLMLAGNLRAAVKHQTHLLLGTRVEGREIAVKAERRTTPLDTLRHLRACT